MDEALVDPFIQTLITYGKRRLNGKRISIFREQLRRILPNGIVEEVYDYYFPIDPKALNQAPQDVVRSALVVACLYQNTDVFRHILWNDNIRIKLHDSKPLEDPNKHSMTPTHNIFMEEFVGYGYFCKETSFTQAVFNMTCFTGNEQMLFAFPPAEVNYSEGLYCLAKVGNHKLVSKIIQVVGCQNVNVQILMSGACTGRNKHLVKLANHYGGFITRKHIEDTLRDITPDLPTRNKAEFIKFLKEFRRKHELLKGQWKL
jgi:hypothetical protein